MASIAIAASTAPRTTPPVPPKPSRNPPPRSSARVSASQAEIEPEVPHAVLLGRVAGDRAGTAVAGVGDVNGDGAGDLLVGAPFSDFGAEDSGIAYLMYGPFSGPEQLSDAETTFRGGGTAALVGWAVSGGDDGILIGGYGNSVSWWVTEPALGELDLGTEIRLDGDNGDGAGYSVSTGEDVNGDGVEDLLIGAPDNDGGGFTSGAAYVVFGPVSADVELVDADVVLVGESSGDRAGYAVALAEDTDGDGLADVLVGAPDRGEGGFEAGITYLLLNASGTVDLVDADARLLGEDLLDGAGGSVGGAGDVNGDGLGDILVGANEDDAGGGGAGAAYLLYGPAVGAMSLSEADAKLIGEENEDSAGQSVAGGGDTNGDGFADVLVGAPNFGAYLLLGG